MTLGKSSSLELSASSHSRDGALRVTLSRGRMASLSSMEEEKYADSQGDMEDDEAPAKAKLRMNSFTDSSFSMSGRPHESPQSSMRSWRFSKKYEGNVPHPLNSPVLTAFLLLNTMLGTGILNQPFVFRESGILGGTIGFIIAAVLTWTGLLCLTAAGIETNTLDYTNLAFLAFGERGAIAVDISIVAVTFSGQMMYSLVVGTLLASLLESWGCSSALCQNVPMTILASAILFTPFCMFREYGELAVMSIFSILSVIAIWLLVVIGGPVLQPIRSEASAYSLFDLTGSLSSFGSMIFSISCAFGNFEAFTSTVKSAENLHSWAIITGVAVGSGALMCFSMGLLGYLSMGEDTEGMILDNFGGSEFDVFKLILVAHLILYVPVNFVILRHNLVKVCSGLLAEQLSTTSHVLATVAIMALAVGSIVLLLVVGFASGQAFSVILNIAGGIAGSFSALLLPAAIYLKVMPKAAGMRLHAQALLLLGTLVMLTVVFFTLWRIAA